MALVGLDVHLAQSVAAVLDPVTGELRVERLRGEPLVVVPRCRRRRVSRTACRSRSSGCSHGSAKRQAAGPATRTAAGATAAADPTARRDRRLTC
jgi:hypothetical protein